jgi:2-octaprenyl-6-methoxyphenol hydroxylase
VAEPYDIIIAGGGPVGAALALGLRDSGHSVALLEARPREAGLDDARTIALSWGSRLILERLGVWPALAQATAIQRITVSQQHGFGRVELSAREAGVPALGYVAAYAALQRALTAALERNAVQVMAGCAARAVSGDRDGAMVSVDCGGAQRQFEARLIAIADGGANLNLTHIKTRDYRQAALVCDVATDEAHQNRAFERFALEGPLALLPNARGWSLVWTTAPDRALALAGLDDAEFCRRLHAAFGAALGAFRVLGRRQVFPLVLKYATRPVAPRTVLIGNAAQTLHPVAGQGFNLGLRDAWELAHAIMEHGAGDPGSSALLNAYFSQRRFDRTATILFTDSLIRLFSKDIPLFSPVRGVGLAALGGIPPAKNFLVRRMLFGARG